MSSNKQLFRTFITLRNKVRDNNISKEELLLLDKISIAVARIHHPTYCSIIRSGQGFRYSWCHRLIQKRMAAKVYPVSKYDQKHKRMILRMSDQTGKSSSVINFISWAMGNNGSLRVIYLTYSDNRAAQITQELISLMIRDDYKRIFPNFKLADELVAEREAEKTKNKLSKREFTNAGCKENEQQGKFIAAGLTSSYLGASGDLIVVDDPFNGLQEAGSETVRENKWQVFTGSVISRQQEYSPIILIGTYWNIDEIQGRVQDIYITNKDQLPPNTCLWELLELNAIKDERNYWYDPRKIGEPLVDFKESYFIDLKLTNPMLFNVKCQNLPLIGTGKTFQPTSFRYYDSLPFSIEHATIVFTIDTSYKAKTKSDATAFQVWAISRMNAYLLEYADLHMNLADLLKYVRDKYKYRYNTLSYIVVEMKALGQGFVDLCGEYDIPKSKILEFEPNDRNWNGDKIYRASLTMQVFDTGQIYLPSPTIMPTINKFVNQFLSFTGEDGRPDDQVDATVQMILKLLHLFRANKIARPQVLDKDYMFKLRIQQARLHSPLSSYKGKYR